MTSLQFDHFAEAEGAMDVAKEARESVWTAEEWRSRLRRFVDALRLLALALLVAYGDHTPRCLSVGGAPLAGMCK